MHTVESPLLSYLKLTWYDSDGRGQKVPMLPFMVGTAFLTNVFYLPYLGLRSSNAEPLTAPAPSDSDAKAIAVGESKALPLIQIAVFLGQSLHALCVRLCTRVCAYDHIF